MRVSDSFVRSSPTTRLHITGERTPYCGHTLVVLIIFLFPVYASAGRVYPSACRIGKYSYPLIY